MGLGLAGRGVVVAVRLREVIAVRRSLSMSFLIFLDEC